MKKTKRFLALALSLIIVLAGTCLSPAVLPALTAGNAVAAGLAGSPQGLKDTAPAGETAAAPETTARSEAAPAGTGAKAIADSLVAETRGKSAVEKLIDEILTPFRHIQNIGGGQSLELILKKFLVDSVGGLADRLIKTILKVFPPRDFVDYEDYQTENFLEGTKTYQTSAAQGAKWHAGYSSVSIVPDNLLTKPYFTAGYFNNYTGKKPITGILDDQCLRVVCVNDGTGNGTAVFISMDGFAFTNANVRKFRARLADFIEANNIVSLNITTSHSHYCIDTSGLGVSLLPYVGQNLLAAATGGADELNAVDEEFMEIILSRGAQAVKDAFNDMKPGKLYYRATDIHEMISDKQSPDVFDPNVNTIRFVPDSKSAGEIWLVNAGIHPTGYPRESTVVSSEYPYAIVKYAKELAGANVAFYQGAQCEISKGETPEGETDFDRIQAFGKKIVEQIMVPVTETEFEPYLNVTHTEVFLRIENPILMAAAKLQIINSTCVDTTGRFEDALLVTEIGYCEFGSKLGIALIPGEMNPEIAFGGAKPAAESWNGTDWEYPSMQDAAGRKLIVFGLTNDEIGYIIPDNEVATTLADSLGGLFGSDAFGPKNGHYPEMLTISSDTGSYITRYFLAMLEDYRTAAQ